MCDALWAQAPAFIPFMQSVSLDQSAAETHNIPDPAPSPETSVANALDHERVRAFVQSLPPLEREVVRRHYWAGERQADIARDLGVTRSAICHMLARVHRVGRGHFGIKVH